MAMGRTGFGSTHTKSSANLSAQERQQWQDDLAVALPIIDDRLYFTISQRAIHSPSIHMFSIDHALRYEPFFVDFGPLNLACLYKFCKLLDHKLRDPQFKKAKIYYFCERSPQKISNAAYLIGAYQLIALHRSPDEAYRRVKKFAEKGVPFRDASMGICTYHCHVRHCLDAIHNAMQWNFMDFDQFNVDEYEHYERVECGDLNVIIPSKFLAFAGPYFKEFDEEGYPSLTPDFYIPIWRKFKVTTIIRLNKKCYDKRIFTKAGFDHHDMYFVDGTTPSDQIVAKFNEICENAKGMLAVHCKAGLGRTGSCVGCYLMKHYAWTAQDVIAWLRVCRPGSVIGPQQQFLERQQKKMWKQGDEYRKKHGIQLAYDRRISNGQHNGSPKGGGHMKVDGGDEQKDNLQSHRKHNVDDDDDIKLDSFVAKGVGSGQPLPTDPGQDQGAALRHAKAKGTVQHQSNSNVMPPYRGSSQWEMSMTTNIGNLGQSNNANGDNAK